MDVIVVGKYVFMYKSSSYRRTGKATQDEEHPEGENSKYDPFR